MRNKSIKESHEDTERPSMYINKGFHSSASTPFDLPKNVSLCESCLIFSYTIRRAYVNLCYSS